MIDTKKGYMGIIMFVPVFIIFYYGIQWLRFGIDLPFYDDWRAFDFQEAGVFSLSVLFKSSNDTIYAVGKFIDFLALQYSGYNVVLYQFLTLLLCLGGIYLFIYLILRKFFEARVLCISLISAVLIFQQDSYWGAQAVAYQQALPILFILIAIYVVVLEEMVSWLRTAIIAFLGVLAGFSYISGAFAVVTIGAVSLLVAYTSRSEVASRYWQASIGFLLAALVTLPLQLRVILVVQKGAIHDPTAVWAWPWGSDFWWFALGMIGRSVGVYGYGDKLWLYLPVAIAFFGIAVALLYSALKTVFLKNSSKRNVGSAYVYLCVACCIGVYMTMVAASRAKLGIPGEDSVYHKLVHGGSRFHYFWLTVLIPFLVANLVEKYVSFGGNLTNLRAYIISLGIFMYAAFAGTFNYERQFRYTQTVAQESLQCIQQKILESKPIICLRTYPLELDKAIQYAKSQNVSFLKYIFFPPEVLESDLTSFSGLRKKSSNDSEIVIDAENDPQLYFTLTSRNRKELSSCRELRITGAITSERSDYFQVFFLSQGEYQYTEQESSVVGYQAGQDVLFDIKVASNSGFQSALRVDPGAGNGRYILRNLSFACDR